MSNSSDSTANEAFPPFAFSDSTPAQLVTATSAPSAVPTTSPEQTTSTRQHVHYGLDVNTELPNMASRLSPRSPASPGITSGVTRSDTELSRIGVRRRNTRANTFKTISEFDEIAAEPGWHPGAEPGIDTSRPDGSHLTGLHAECQITIVDFSQDHFVIHELDNNQLCAFVQAPQPAWVKCRWINVNGLSYDVIQALGNYKNLHRLAIEDIMNSRNRTKVDW
jgi:hypothetical protein